MICTLSNKKVRISIQVVLMSAALRLNFDPEAEVLGWCVDEESKTPVHSVHVRHRLVVWFQDLITSAVLIVFSILFHLSYSGFTGLVFCLSGNEAVKLTSI